MRLQRRAVAGQLHRRRPGELGPRLQHVLRDVDQHRAGPAGAGEVERLGQDPRQVLGRLHEVVVLGDRQRDAVDVGLLEGVRADRAARDLAGDRDHGDRVHVRVGDRRHQVGRARDRTWRCRRPPCRWPGRSRWRRARRPARGGPGCGAPSESKIGSYAGRIAPPGMPNMTSTPSASSDRTSDWAPVTGSGAICRPVTGPAALTAAGAPWPGRSAVGLDPAATVSGEGAPVGCVGRARDVRAVSSSWRPCLRVGGVCRSRSVDRDGCSVRLTTKEPPCGHVGSRVGGWSTR